jgi:hypothetical protein
MNKKQTLLPSDWLIGTWRSDKQRTVEAWGKYPPRPLKFQTAMLRELGRLTFRYSGKRVTSTNGNLRRTEAYHIVWQSPKYAFLVFGPKKEESCQLLHFEAPGLYWVHTGRFVEFFSKESQEPGATKRG